MSNGNFIVYKSSAGSGKTFTLVKEYLKLALKDKHDLSSAFKGILAITFTNKAASEMKSRIIKALKELASDDNKALMSILVKEMNISEEELQQRASHVLSQILHHYSDFSIGTIDSFTHRIIRTFALDLKLPVNFQIEMDTESVFTKIISLLINKLGQDDLITDYLVRFSLTQVEENKSWDPEKGLYQIINELNKEGKKDLIDKLNKFSIKDFEHIKEQLEAEIKNYYSTLSLIGNDALQLIQKSGVSVEDFYQKKSGIVGFFNKLINLKNNSEPYKKNLINSYVKDTIENDKWYTSSKSTNSAVIENIKHQLIDLYHKAVLFIDENQEKFIVYSSIKSHIHAIGLVNELAKLIEEYKKEENILFISEFNERISNVVSSEPTPFIFERLGERYKHFLLDEFQDTSNLQWHNMLPLVDNALGNGNLNLIVGDGKQSIYRWRNADVKQFVNLPSIENPKLNPIITERESALKRNFKEQFLDTNFRSDSVVVDFNNSLFDYLSKTVLSTDYEKIYHNQKQLSKKPANGYVSIDFPQQIKDDENDDINTIYALNYIKQAINDGYDYKDICIIVRKNSEGNQTANYLINQKIPVVSSDSLLLANSPEIKLITAFISYLINHQDLISASSILNYLYQEKKINEEQFVSALRELNIYKKKTLHELLNQFGINIEFEKLFSSNLFDTCIEIINAFGLNHKNPIYIRFFLDEILAYLQNHTSNHHAFLTWWEKRSEKASLVIPEGVNAVNIMTIHASKGLEFPVVISPFMSGNAIKDDTIWVELDSEKLDLPVALLKTGKKIELTRFKDTSVDEQQQQILDTLNVLYVNFTRAVDRLHIISPIPSKNSQNNYHNWLYQFAEQSGKMNADKKQYESGKLNTKHTEHKSHGALPQINIETLHTSVNKDTIQIKKSNNYQYQEEVEKAREYGILIHWILSQINSEADVEQAIHLAMLSGEINQQEAEQLKKDISEILKKPIISDLFSGKYVIKNELEILTKEGTILRPDRVVIDGTTATVIDYKTGKRNTEKYHRQLSEYENALKELGYQSVKKLILYIQENEVEEVK